MKSQRPYDLPDEEQSKIADSVFKLLEGQSVTGAETILHQVQKMILVNSVVKELPDE